MLKSLNKGRKSGFSLIELVIAMAILAILVGVVSMRSGNLARPQQSHQDHPGLRLRSKPPRSYSTPIRVATRTTPPTLQPAIGRGHLHRLGWSLHRRCRPLPQQPLTASCTSTTTTTAFGRVTGWDLDGDGTEETTGGATVVLLSASPTRWPTSWTPTTTTTWLAQGAPPGTRRVASNMWPPTAPA